METTIEQIKYAMSDGSPRDWINKFVHLLANEDDRYRSIAESVLLDIVKDADSICDEYIEYIRWIRMTPVERVSSLLENLPIDRSGLDSYRPLGFALISDKWVPLYNFEYKQSNGYIVGGIRYEDKSTSTQPCSPGTWAHATADDEPSMPWAWELSDMTNQEYHDIHGDFPGIYL